MLVPDHIQNQMAMSESMGSSLSGSHIKVNSNTIDSESMTMTSKTLLNDIENQDSLNNLDNDLEILSLNDNDLNDDVNSLNEQNFPSDNDNDNLSDDANVYILESDNNENDKQTTNSDSSSESDSNSNSDTESVSTNSLISSDYNKLNSESEDLLDNDLNDGVNDNDDIISNNSDTRSDFDIEAEPYMRDMMKTFLDNRKQREVLRKKNEKLYRKFQRLDKAKRNKIRKELEVMETELKKDSKPKSNFIKVKPTKLLKTKSSKNSSSNTKITERIDHYDIEYSILNKEDAITNLNQLNDTTVQIEKLNVQPCWCLYHGDIRGPNHLEKQQFEKEMAPFYTGPSLYLGRVTGNKEAIATMILRNYNTNDINNDNLKLNSNTSNLNWPSNTEFKLICGDGCGVKLDLKNQNQNHNHIVGEVGHKEFAAIQLCFSANMDSEVEKGGYSYWSLCSGDKCFGPLVCVGRD